MKRTLIAGLCLAGFVSAAHAAQDTHSALDDAIAKLGHQWAKASYQTPKDEQEKAFDALVTHSAAVADTFPGRAEPLVWEAIVLSSAAKVSGGLGALSKVKQARDLLQQAEHINPTVLNGSIYNSLGVLYAKVPGWPLGFGDKDKARSYLKKALEINPEGIDPNYFYADLLADEGKVDEARQYLQRAISAPPRPGREDADEGRRAQIRALMAKLDGK